MDILKNTLNLEVKERLNYWLDIAKEIEEKHDYECLIESVDGIYLKNGVEEHKLFGFYQDTDLEEFFIYNNINVDFDNKNNTCTMTFEDKKYQVETVELINRHGDDLCDEMVLQLHTLREI